MASTDATPLPLKNTAYYIEFQMILNTGLKDSGATLTPTISIDGAGFNATSDSPSEIGSSGKYAITFTNSEMDGDCISFQCYSTTSGSIPLLDFTIYPSSLGKFQVDVQSIFGTQTATPGTTGGLVIAGANDSTSFLSLSIGGNVGIAGDVTVAGAFQITGALTVSSASTFDSIEVSNALNAGSCFIGGAVSFGSLTVSNDFAVGGAVSFTGGLASNITGNLSGSVGSVTGFTPSDVTAIKASTVKIQAAIYDSATLSGSTLTLSNGHTMVTSTTGRVTT